MHLLVAANPFQEMLQRNAGNHLWAELILERAAVVVDDPRDDLGSFYWRTKSRDTKIVGRQIAATPAAKRKRKATSEGEGTIEPVKQARR